MLRVPGGSGNLEEARAQGADVRVVYSTLDALEIARQHPDRPVIFLGVGFETTAPTIAARISALMNTGSDPVRTSESRIPRIILPTVWPRQATITVS